MKRRTFIGSLFAGISAICFPWRWRKRKKSLEEIKQEILAEYMRSPGGRTAVFATIAFPIVRRHNYTALGRDLFPVEKRPDGALPIYDKEPIGD